MTPEEARGAARELLKTMFAAPSAASLARMMRRLELETAARVQTLWQIDFAKLVEDEEAGDRDARVSLYEWAALAVAASSNLPLPLRNWTSDALLVLAETERRKRGRNPADLLARDFSIIYTVARVCEQGFSATRSQDHQHSACSIVKQALDDIGEAMSEDNVERIWDKRLQLQNSLREYVDGARRIPFGLRLS